MADRQFSLLPKVPFLFVIGMSLLLMTGVQAESFPATKRQSPGRTLSPAQTVRINHVFELYNAGDLAPARSAADAVLADATATKLEQAKAAQVAAQAALATDQPAAAIAYYQRAVGLDVLDNDAHFGAMRNLAMLQQQQALLADSIATYERFFAATGSSKPQDLVAYGNGLYLAGRYPEATAVIQQAVDASATPDPQWRALLMQAHIKSGKTADAVRVAEQVAAGSPDDKRAQTDLATLYQRNGMPVKAADVLEGLRSRGQFQQATEYRQLASIYVGMEGGEPRAIDVICAGLQSEALEPDFETLEELARLYFFSEQFDASINLYQQIAPLDTTGDTYLDLAGLLWEAKRPAESQDAAREALSRGLANDEDRLNARNILTHVVPRRGASAARPGTSATGGYCAS
ncbi:MAG: tetratricopeptide repeat protein [Lysobacter sp.]